MNRLSMRPRPLDINKKLKIVTSVREFEDDELTTSSRQFQIHRPIVEAETKVHRAPGKKFAAEIPTPKYVEVEAYETQYSQTFTLSASYIRGRAARAEFGEFVEYDLDNEDEDWLQRFNEGSNILSPDKFETILFKLEILDYKAQRVRVISHPLGSSVPVLLQLDSAAEVLKPFGVKYSVLMSVYDYWKKKRQRWRKPILRQLQPRPSAHDRNPNNVFRPRVKIHRPHTRRIQRHENNVHSFEKLRQVRRNFDQAKMILEALIEREKRKLELIKSEVDLQRIQLKYKNEVQLLEVGLAQESLSSFTESSDEEDHSADSDDMSNHGSRSGARTAMPYGGALAGLTHDPHEQVLLFTKTLIPERLAAAGIVPLNPLAPNGPVHPPFNLRGRMGRGGRIIFDRWNPLLRTPYVR